MCDIYQEKILIEVWHTFQMADLINLWPGNLGCHTRPYPIYVCDITWENRRWEHILLADESRFNLHFNDDRRRLYRRQGERCDDTDYRYPTWPFRWWICRCVGSCKTDLVMHGVNCCTSYGRHYWDNKTT